MTDLEPPRYVLACDGCGWTDDRDRNSQVVKDVRHRKRACPDCGGRLHLERDNRPDPPFCPDCGEEAIEVRNKDHDSRPTEYVHEISVVESAGVAMKELDGCFVGGDENG